MTEANFYRTGGWIIVRRFIVIMNNRSIQNRFTRAIKKSFYTAFVAITFILYALENRGTAGVSNIPASGGPNPSPTSTTPAADPSSNNTGSIGLAAPTASSPATQAPTNPPTATNAPTATTSSGYKDGTYTGAEVDVRWGLVQVQTTIQGGQIANVKVTESPSDRRTSQRINSIAVPELQQEAVQAQSANVNIITGATLTSEGFQMSLQDALSQAKG
jgi:uncharacterized protein with FMN-binding domain